MGEGCCCGSGKEKPEEKKVIYECGCCGRTSDKQEECCGEQMKEKK